MHTPALSPERKLLAILCALAALALIWATLWPFNPFPANGVSWLSTANGVLFRGGVIFSDGPLKDQAAAAQAARDSCTIEIYLRPLTRDDAGNFFTLSSRDDPDAVFLRQWHESLLIYRRRAIRGLGPKHIHFDVDDVLRADRLVLVTISSGPRGVTVYIDGKLVPSAAAPFRIHRNDLYRQIVLGNSPSNFQVWNGEIHGLAIYDDEVSPAEAATHFAAWSGASLSGSDANSETGDTTHLLARYDFHERKGSTIRSAVELAPPLVIPVHFSIPLKPRLASPIQEFDWSANYRRDVYENILGFMPFGFVLCGFFALSRSRGQAILISTFLGGLLSFTVEFLQYYIPRRDSGWTDVITNTTGTLLGALIARPGLVRDALRLVHLIPPNRESETN